MKKPPVFAAWPGLLLLALALVSVSAQGRLVYLEDATGRHASENRSLIQWTHSRLVFDREIERVAVGQTKTLEVEVLGGRELLLLAKEVGRTTLIVWYQGGETETFLFSVTEDLSVLRGALRDIHPDIRLELAPDRPALTLRGRVPSVDFKIAAEAAATHYLGARTDSRRQHGRLPGVGGQTLDNNPLHILSQVQQSPGDAFRLNAEHLSQNSRVAIINLIQIEELPATFEAKILEAIRPMGAGNVNIRRVVRGVVPDDAQDTFILEGEVRDQVTLTRVLNVASKLLLNTRDGAAANGALVALTDEAGGLIGTGGGSVSSLSSTFGTGLGSSAGGGQGNRIKSNVGRSKLISVGNGRLLSVIEVGDLPQVRVAVQIHEINRNRMFRWRPDLSLVTEGYNTNGLLSLGGLSSRAADSSMVENALQILGGTLTNNLQVGGSDAAFDLLFSLMEQDGISRTLSRPNLTVMAGESAVFSVGGEVPVPTAFAPSGLKSGDEVAANTPGVFSGTSFKSFGVELSVRAMVDEDDRITLDINPTISAPDTLLTQQISQSTGSSLNSTAFNTRSIHTTTRLNDGQPLILGGLIYREQSAQNDHTPGLQDIPLIGHLAEATSKSEQDRELVIVVTPTLIREPNGLIHQWAFPAVTDIADRTLSLSSHGYQEN
ncbi:pilus assembly protein N-terminal domain-containing protein [Marinobacter sp.]|uniref:pilus assembly protein N-terminal domain-containing protein n=1 Tax=Marinobacter sp. TaxID=50741 RepID=UPI000C6386A2|nr:pilus assembly protein N-terminal domain-containing protein [Marinobacter sp.]MBP54412.1 type II and III secretion system protein [Marinobacter sp.]